VTIKELSALFGLSPRTIQDYVYRKILPPARCTGRGARAYGREHVEALRAYMAIRHNNVSAADAVRFCDEEGISLPEFVRRREVSIKTFGIGIA
jgi:DNA-binding transcriptional MerR regulator